MKPKASESLPYVFLFLMGCLLLLSPAILAVNRLVVVVGVPVSFLYVFGVWFIIIAIAWRIARKSELDKT